jgi:RHS repeat-associated protein
MSSFNQRCYTFAGATVAAQTATGAQASGTVDFLLGDVRGSVTLTARRSDATTSSQWYSAYGNTGGSQSTMGVTTRAYIGQIRDPGHQLNYLHARYQDPATGLFLSVDPLVAKTGEPYLYASGNPTNLSDPSGLEPGCGNTTRDDYGCSTAHGLVQDVLEKKEADARTARTVVRLLDTGTAPLNSWLETCARAYQACVGGTIDPSDGMDGAHGVESSENFLLAMALLNQAVSSGAATLDATTGWLMGDDDYLFLLWATDLLGVFYVDLKSAEVPWPEVDFSWSDAFGVVSNVAGMIAVGCWFAGPAGAGCAAVASGIATVAGVAAVATGYAEGSDAANCNAGALLVGFLLPGPMEDMPGSHVLGVVNGSFDLGASVACG